MRLLALTIFFFAIAAHAQSIEFQSGNRHISAEVVADGVFRLSASTQPSSDALPSIFLAPTSQPAANIGTVLHTGGGTTLQTEHGSLQLDSAAGEYTLLDGQGKVVSPTCPILGDGGIDHIAMNVGWPKDTPFAVYGCGNGAHNLAQKKINTRVGNGVAIEPFFWSPSGYAVLAVSENGNDPAKCDGAVHDEAVSWTAPGGSEDLYLIVTPTLGEASRQLLRLTGEPPVPPRWTMGYMQSRWGWKDKAYIDDALQQFKTRKIPVDCFIFDFEWYTTLPDYQVKPEGVDGYSDFNFNPALFPDPANQIQQMHDAGIRWVGIRKPRLGNSETLKMVRGKGWGFHSDIGENIDKRGLWFADPAARDWYVGQTVPLLKTGIDGWWDDEGEFTYTNYIYWDLAQRQALDQVRPNDRLWTIDRAFQPGLSRTGASAWTGDIHATWQDLERTPTALLNWSIAGMPWCACDIGGHVGETNALMLTRWMEAGTFFPIMRTHSTLKVQPHFPWLFGDEAEAAMKKAIELRYRLVPMLYSLAHVDAATRVMQPLLSVFPNDPKVADMSDEWMFGPSILAAPVLTEKSTRSIYLPAGKWYDLFTNDAIDGSKSFDVTVPNDAVPAFVRAGSILPMGPVVQTTADLPGGPLEVRVYPGADADFTLYEDDGLTKDYEKGVVRQTAFHWDDATRELTWKRTGNYAGKDVFTSMTIEAMDSKQSVPQNDFAAEGSLKLK